MGKSTIYRWFIDDFRLRSAFYRGFPSHVFAMTALPQFIRSMAATAVGWCPREEALEVQEVEMKAFPSFRWGYHGLPVVDGNLHPATPMTEPPAGARSLISRTWRIWSIWSLPGADRNPLMKWCPLVFGMLILLSHSGTRANVASSVKIRAGDTATARWMDRWMDRWIRRIPYQ